MRRPTCASRSTSARSSPGCSTAAGSRSSSRSTATSWCAAGARSAGSRSACSATTGSCSPRRRKKGAQFIQLCNRTDTPLVSCTTSPASWSGRRPSRAASSSNGAKLINAVSNSTVPHFALMVGASYGAGNYGMSGKAYDPRFIFSWPNHRIAVMGPKQLAGVMDIVARNAAAGRGVEVDEEATRRRRPAALEAQIEHESTALYATGRDLGRRDHPSRATPGRCSGWRSRPPTATSSRAPPSTASGGTDGIRAPAHRQPRRDRRADRARPHAAWASRPSACTPSPTATRCTSTRSTSPWRSAGRRPAESYLRGDAIIAGRARHRMRRHPPRLRLPRRERRVRAGGDRRRADLGRADARADPPARRQGGGEEGGDRRRRADHADPRGRRPARCPTA